VTSNNTPDPLTDQQLDEIETRAAHLHEYGDPTDTRTAGWEELARTDVPALIAEIRRLQAERQSAAPEFTEARTAFMHIGRTPSLEGLRAELRIEGHPPVVGRYIGASMGRMLDVPGHEHLLAIDPKFIFEYADEQPTADASEACGKCKQPFDPADTRFDGQARHYLTPYCRGCVDRCHDNESADHRCVICA
jgi:hypothetical protein